MKAGVNLWLGAWNVWLRAEIVFPEAERLILDADFPADPFQR